MLVMSGLHIAAVLILCANPLCHYNTRSRHAWISYVHCVYTRESGSSQSSAPPRTRVVWFYCARGGIPGRLRSAAWKKKGVKRPRQANNSTEHERVAALIKANWEFLAIEKSQLPAIVRHNLVSNRAHKSRFYEGRSETCRVTFFRQIIRK